MEGSKTRNHSRAEVVAGDIRDRIQSDSLESGHRLGTKQDLREEYGVAPATINETLKLLTARRLVNVRPGPGGGVFVADQPPIVRLGHKVLSLSAGTVTASDCLVVRDALEEPIATDAAEHATREDVSALRAILEDVRASAADPTDYLHNNWLLHMRIAEITPNFILKNYYLGVMEYLETHVANVLPDNAATDFEEGVEVHAALVDAIAAHDRAAAIAAVGRHDALTHPAEDPNAE